LINTHILFSHLRWIAQDFATLEVHVYDQMTGNLYVHHDIPLPSFPLCLAHGQVSSGGTTGNFCAVGTFSPGIEIWNLDVLNALEPSCILGGDDTTTADDIMMMQMRKGNKGSQKIESETSLRPGSHTDAVMALSWNNIHKQALASGSADRTVKLWDITQAGDSDATCNVSTFRHHRDKV
jgi:periodic tryptophan protein 1